ncbi:MAG: phage holin family protein [Bacteroidetes bacterium]|nr:MAG: phage holin family protein [Bacteroidota bacterium]
MPKFLKKLLLTSIFVFLLPYFMKGIHISGFLNALLFTIALAFLNSILKPILVFLSLPITIVTLGLFLIIINTVLIYIAAYFVGGVRIDNFIYGIVFSTMISVFSYLIDWAIGD